MSKHTPGPWVARNMEPNTFGHDWVDGPDRREIAVTGNIVANTPHGYCGRVEVEEIAANTNLIAAAPDMFAELSAIASDTDFDLIFPAHSVARIRAVLAKARGETP